MLNRYFIKWIMMGSMTCGMLVTGKLHAQKNFFEKLVPDHAKVQYAGGIGFVSAGFGYANRKKNFEFDLYYGYVPPQTGNVDIHSATAKFNWSLIRAIRTEKFTIKPLVTGILINYSFGDRYFGFDPERYSFRYYWFPTSLHSGFLVGSQAGINLPDTRSLKEVAIYFEILSFDRELISYISNSTSLSVSDILTLGVGIKLGF